MKTLLTALLVISLLGVFNSLAAQDMFDNADGDKNQVLVYTEVTAVLPAVTKDTFDTVDQNADGVLDYDEFALGYVQGYLRRPRLPGLINMPVIANNNAPDS